MRLSLAPDSRPYASETWRRTLPAPPVHARARRAAGARRSSRSARRSCPSSGRARSGDAGRDREGRERVPHRVRRPVRAAPRARDAPGPLVAAPVVQVEVTALSPPGKRSGVSIRGGSCFERLDDPAVSGTARGTLRASCRARGYARRRRPFGRGVRRSRCRRRAARARATPPGVGRSRRDDRKRRAELVARPPRPRAQESNVATSRRFGSGFGISETTFSSTSPPAPRSGAPAGTALTMCQADPPGRRLRHAPSCGRLPARRSSTTSPNAAVTCLSRAVSVASVFSSAMCWARYSSTSSCTVRSRRARDRGARP